MPINTAKQSSNPITARLIRSVLSILQRTEIIQIPP